MPDNCIAAIDMGTNSFHLIITEVKKDGSLKIIDREREVIRLGSQQGENLSIISADEIERAISILKNFKKLADSYNAVIRAVATSAVREAKNREIFLSKVFAETGIKIEVPEGKREAELIYLGAEKALRLNGKKSLCLDIGGGSSEFIYSEKGTIIFAESVKIGAVRLSKKFFPDFLLTGKLIEDCGQFVESEILSNININRDIEFDITAGTSGTIQSVARTIYFRHYNKQPDSLNNFSFSREDLEEFYTILVKNKTLEERLLIPGIEEKRADILPAGIIILKKAFELFNINKMTISEYALREGIVLESLKKHNTGL